MQIPPDATPGTGEQVTAVATPESADDDLPSTFRACDKTWKVGHEYWDEVRQDLVTLSSVIRRSSWRDTRPPEECPPTLVFIDGRNQKIRVDPNDPSGETQKRFTLRKKQTPARRR